MAMLARSTSAPPSLRASMPMPALASVEGNIEAGLVGTIVVALPEGALWVEAGRALVVADLHFEKGSAFAKRGQMLPPYDTRATLQRLAGLMDEHAPEIVVSLGDAFHDGGGPARMSEDEREQVRALVARADWIWIEGNHEGRSAEALGGVARDRLQLGPLLLRHEPTGAAGEVAGHLHPCARVSGRGGSVRRRCFAYDGSRIVLPAFGAYAGGLNVLDPVFAPVFPDGAMALVLGKDRVLPVGPERLAPD